MIKNFNFDYDLENDSLFMYDPKSKSKASIEMDDFVIDFNSKKKISGIELLNASVLFKDMSTTDLDVTKDLLNNIKECKIDIIERNNSSIIKFMLKFKTNEILQTPLLVPTINEPSPSVQI